MSYLFTSESVSEGHPDKVSDQIADAILDEFLRRDPQSKVACETLCTTGLVVVAGEVRSNAYVDIQATVRRVVNRIGYTHSDLRFDGDSCGVLSAIHEQSEDIRRGVDKEEFLSGISVRDFCRNEATNRGDVQNLLLPDAEQGAVKIASEKQKEQGAGDQGIMFGYACNETREYMPATLILAHVILKELAVLRREKKEMCYLRPDAKSQVTIEYDEQTRRPLRVHTIVVSTQHDENVTQEQIRADVQNILIPRVKRRLERAEDKLCRLIGDDYILHVNPTGKFVIGGPHGDTGVTGRKIIVDSYGGRGAHGGGAFSGKDSSKVDRSAAYAARYMAKNMVAAGIAEEVLVQLSYAIGIAKPISLYVETRGKKVDVCDGEIARRIEKLFDLRPASIVRMFGLNNPIFEATAAYGHFGNRPYTCTETICGTEREVEFFGWERLDAVAKIKAAF